MKTRLKGIAVVAALVIATFAVAGSDEMAEHISSAKTAAEHDAIAADYKKQADEAREKAQMHDKMGESYTSALKAKLHLDQHCKTIADSYRRIAKESDALAAAHHEQAKHAK